MQKVAAGILCALGVAVVALRAVGAAAGQNPPQTPPQQQPPGVTFRSTSETVPVYATVVDREGRLVSDLTRDDFEIFDNDKPVDITLFKSDVQPMAVVVMLDTSGSMTNSFELLKQAAESFVIRLMPGDHARVGKFDDLIFISPTFTDDRDELIRTLREDIRYGNGTRLWDGVDTAMTALSHQKDRRVVVVFTDGDDTTSKKKLDSVLERAQNEEYMVYAIGLRSHMLGMPDTRPDKGLKKLASETGGGYFELTEAADLNSTFTKVADELHRQFVLGFSPKVLDGKLHRLDVRVKQPGMTARARKTYLANPSR
jgi:VWFA-related protein